MVVLPLRQMPVRRKQKSLGDHEKFLARVTKTLNYGKYPPCDRTSLPVTELAAQLFSRAKGKVSLEFLDIGEAARISRNASISPCSLVLALLYLDRLKASNSKYLAKVPPSQLFLISLMVGSKFLQDDGQDDEVNNCEWATYAGLTIQDINCAEREFLTAIEWEVYVSKEEFWRRLRGVEQMVGLREGCKRGWFSYTELELLLHTVQLAALAKTLAHISIACLAGYTASVFALLGSTMLVTQVPGIIPAPRTVSHPPAIPPLPVEPSFIESDSFPSDVFNAINRNYSDDELESTIKAEFEVVNCELYLPNHWNYSQYCDEAPNDKALFTFDFGSLWQHLDMNQPVTSWASSLQRFLVQESRGIAVA